MEKPWSQFNTDLSYMRRYVHTPSSLAISTYYYILVCGHFRCNSGYFTRRKNFPGFLLIYTLSGKGHLAYRDKVYELTKGQAFIIQCSDFQDYRTDSQDLWEFKYVQINGMGCEAYFNQIYAGIGPVVELSDEAIEKHMDRLMQMKEMDDLQFEIKASSIIVQILTELLLSKGEISSPVPDPHSRQIQRALDFITKNYSRKISLKDIAGEACCSVYHFTRIFKCITGFSPYEYLVKCRINRAKCLLITTEQTIDEISRAVGFESPCNFTRTFKELEMITPSKYRKTCVM